LTLRTVVVEAYRLQTDRDLATFVEGLKAVAPAAAPKRGRSAGRGRFAFPSLTRANTFRIFLAAAFAAIVFFGTIAWFANQLQQP
jgi:hypothetical protein